MDYSLLIMEAAMAVKMAVKTAVEMARGQFSVRSAETEFVPNWSFAMAAPLESFWSFVNWRFIKDFSKISKPLTNLLQKDVPFVFDDDCKEAFETLKKALTTAPIVEPPDWNLPFEIMCDASDFAVVFLDSE
ncbi:hypothetical protein QYE76_050725 [Lolium multiflorum]|uniref:Reverse transcriptase/retrotransposon-derived protein RNase H-like domain-containing protein n=1 Tax=Lolium multiflorum TaxID=4521 RepID=A0AAD8SQL1_LOLMU|nr:hypothetical protein QYE76_050725 [Lolium multiflorum]